MCQVEEFSMIAYVDYLMPYDEMYSYNITYFRYA